MPSIVSSKYRRNVTSLTEIYFRYLDVDSAVAGYQCEDPWPLGNDSDLPATSPEYCFDIRDKSILDLAYINAADGAMNDFVLRTKFTELLVACCRTVVPVFLSMLDVV